MVPAGVSDLWAHPLALPICRAMPEMACGKRPAPVAAYVTDAVMGTGPCLVRDAAAAGASTEPDKRGVGARGTFSPELPFHGCGLRELLRQSGAPQPSRASLYRCDLRDDSVGCNNNMYWCLAAQEQTVMPAPLSRGAAFCAEAAVVGQSTDGLGEAGCLGGSRRLLCQQLACLGRGMPVPTPKPVIGVRSLQTPLRGLRSQQPVSPPVGAGQHACPAYSWTIDRRQARAGYGRLQSRLGRRTRGGGGGG